MKRIFLTAFLLSSPITPVTAQVADGCAPAGHTMPNCFVGSWIGANTIGIRIKEMLERMAPAGVARTAFPDEFQRVIGMIIYPDGFFHSPPFNSSVLITDIKDDIYSESTFSFSSQGSVGWIWTEGGALRFCNTPGGGGLLGMAASSPDGGDASTTITIPDGAPTFMPEISFACDATLLTMNVHLPAPIGTIDHYFTRVPDDRYGEYLRGIDDARYGVPEVGE